MVKGNLKTKKFTLKKKFDLNISFKTYRNKLYYHKTIGNILQLLKN